MNKLESLEFCYSWLPAWTGNKPETLIAFYSMHTYYQDPARPSGIQGREQLLFYFRKLLLKYPNWVWTVADLFPLEKGFILKWRAKISDESTENFYGMDIIELDDDDKIIRNEVYFDPSILIKANQNRV